MRGIQFLFAIAVFSLLCGFGNPAAADGTMLTVTGKITNTNRPGFDPFNDALFKSLEINFKNAYAFNRKELSSLPQHTVKANYPDWPSTTVVKGPKLVDLLATAGAKGQTIVIRAIDGYAPEFDLSDIDINEFVLALEANNEPLAIGGRGPLWLVIPPNSYEGQPDDDGNLVWAVFHIEVR